MSLNMTMTQFHVFISVALFCLGAMGFLSRRSGIVALMCLELMLNGANLMLITFSRLHGNPEGSVLFLFVILVAAAEAAIALSVLVAVFRKTGSVYLDDFKELKG